MRIAVVDIGTNSVRLLISQVNSGEISPIETGLITTRLGEGIGRKRLLKRSIKRTVEALFVFRQRIVELGVEKVIVVATSAVRDAANRSEFLAEVKNYLGWDVRVLSGIEEAALSYQGAVGGLKCDDNNSIVIDIGGGSTEFIWSQNRGLNFVSLQLGAVRMTENQNGLEDIRKLMAETLAEINNQGLTQLIGVGGTMTTLAAIDQELGKYNPEKVHGYFLTRNRVLDILHRLEQMSLEQRKAVAGLQPQRADIIVAGVRIVVAALEGVNTKGVTVSETDIMYGLLYQALGQKIK